MGKEEKKPEELKQPEAEKREEKAEKPATGDGETAAPEIVLKVYMHCEGCARKVRRCLAGLDGVEDVRIDCKTHTVAVKGERVDPLKILERVRKKSNRTVEILSPIPNPSTDDLKKEEEKESPKPEQTQEEASAVITAVLKVHMHCEACAQKIRKRIMRMKGVESADPDLKSSQVTVKGVFDPVKLVEYIYKRTAQRALIMEDKEEDGAGKIGKEDTTEDGAGAAAKGEEEFDGATEVDVKKSENSYYAPPMHAGDIPAYPPEIFSDENPNACSIM